MTHPDGDPIGLPKAPPLVNPAPVLRGTNKAAIASIICASLCCSLIGTPLAIILGHAALHQIRRYEQDGRGIAMVGLAIGYASLAFWVAMVITIRQS